MLLRNRRFLELEGHDLKFGLHGYLLYDKVKVNVDFRNNLFYNLNYFIEEK